MKNLATTKQPKSRSFFTICKVSKITLTLLLIFVFSLKTSFIHAQNARLSFNLKQTPIEKILRQIEQQSNYHFLYNNNMVNVDKKIDLQLSDATIEQVLIQIFKDEGVKYQIKGNQVILTPQTFNNNQDKEQNASQQTRTLTGTIVDNEGEPLPGASVWIKGTTRGTTADINGNFTIPLNANDKLVIVSFLGMQSKEVSVQNQRNIKVELLSDSELLDEVIVTGYQTISKERATGAFTVVSPKLLKDRLQPNILSRLEGQVAGLVQQKDALSIRGRVTLRGGVGGFQPLYVVDGMPFQGDLGTINPAIIENITVLKDAAAASIYGAKAANGVIVITTKEGSRDGKTKVTYDGSVRFLPTPDFNYLNLMSSEELVDLQQFGFKYIRNKYENLNHRYSLNPVQELLYKHRSQLITDAELKAGLDTYRNLDNRDQIKDFYLRTGVMHQHNLSISAGSASNRYIASVNYIGNQGNAKYSNSDRLGLTLRNTSKFFDWLTADLGVYGNFNKSQGDNGMGNYYTFYTSYPSYYMLRDNDGAPLDILGRKSLTELERLRSIGLKDETYSPIRNRQEETFSNNQNYYRVQLGLNFKIMEGLNLDVKYQTENSSYKQRDLYSKNSYFVRKMINDAAQYDKDKKELTLNVPEGGQLRETRGDTHSYTFRTQLNFFKETGKHYITALAGAERQAIKSSSTNSYYMGYDDNSLGYKPINPLILAPLSGTESVGGSFNWNFTGENYLRANEDRFVSFYGNASYTYDRKYNFTGSIRVDQSNLFGTDPKYQYRPLWSLGTSWYMGEEEFLKETDWINMLNLRVTYGIGGNVPKDAGPFLTLYAPQYNSWINDFGAAINNPPNPSLRWEKTATTNIGVDFSLLSNTLGGSIDYYNKYTTDLLSNKDADPTLGWDKLMLNYGSMYNRGVDVSLNANIRDNGWQWSPSVTFSYNKNKLIKTDDTERTVFRYSNGNASAEGYPMGAVFSYRFAGLSEKNGSPLYYDKEGEKKEYIGSIDDLVYSGTRIPVYSASFNNRISYKNASLSFMFVYYGGHVMRGETSQYLSNAPGSNQNRELLNVWREPGDEKKPNVVPAFTGAYVYSSREGHQWPAADIHVVKADYVKLRDLSLSYNFDKKWIHNLRMESLMLTLQIQNLWTWKANKKGFDPEAMSTVMYGWGTRTLPSPTTYTIGASVSF